MKKLFILLICLTLGIALKAGVTLNYGFNFTAGESGKDIKSIVAKNIHAGFDLDLTEKISISLNGVMAPDKWADIKNLNISNLNPELEFTIHHKF